MTIQGQAFHAATGDPAALPIEIGFLLRHDAPELTLRQAAKSAQETGCSADEALIKLGLMEEAAYYRALAAEIGFPFLDGDLAVASDTRFPDSILLGLAHLAARDDGLRCVLAPAGPRIAWLLTRTRPCGRGLAITSPSALMRAVLRARADAIAASAANALADAQPHRSYRDAATKSQKAFAALGGALALIAAWLAPAPTFPILTILSGVIFFGMVVVRIAAARVPVPTNPGRLRRAPDHTLPVWTVIVPMRREGRVLARLIRSLEALDYPKPKLQAVLVIEADDREMAAAFSQVRLPPYFEVVVAPPGAPRTKPRALNVVLPLARGEFVTVYDAEDVPDPDQLRIAAATFARSPADVVCLQARLVIDNTDDNWLTRFFTIEYATLFDVINPGLAANDLPVPLGGTSNHFRTDVLQRLHGWDAWNVTEDADLGIRLALAGYRVLDLPSSTLEEAPSTWKPWFGQRIRWMKGFMQVVTTHSRHPLATLRALGPVRFFAAVTMTLGTVVTALGYPLFTLLTVAAICNGTWLDTSTTFEAVATGIGVTLFPTGLAAMMIPAVVALKRRRWWRLLVYVPLLPLYYGLISVAAWQALFEFVRHPFRWHKTEHGFARTSRSGFFTGAAAAPAPIPPAGG